MCTAASSEITSVHVARAMKALSTLGICGKGVMVEDSLTINYRDSGVSPGATKMFNWAYQGGSGHHGLPHRVGTGSGI